jgi:hypothetical protein
MDEAEVSLRRYEYNTLWSIERNMKLARTVYFKTRSSEHREPPRNQFGYHKHERELLLWNQHRLIIIPRNIS